jgi:thiol-disulfide isomerase/thioredoxin
MLPFKYFEAALPYQEFLTKFGNSRDQARWDAARQNLVLTANQLQILSKFRRKTNVLVLAGAWCGDCANSCPVFERFAQAAPTLEIRYLERDTYPDAQTELRVNGGNRVPMVIFFSEDGFEVARYGERTLTEYLQAISSEVKDFGPDLISTGADSYSGAIISDWLREFLRVECILRLSPRLRKLHAD